MSSEIATGKTYYFVDENSGKKTWDGCSTFCSKNAISLAVINSVEDNDKVWELAKLMKENLWIGNEHKMIFQTTTYTTIEDLIIFCLDRARPSLRAQCALAAAELAQDIIIFRPA